MRQAESIAATVCAQSLGVQLSPDAEASRKAA
jgi:hypothetical protein